MTSLDPNMVPPEGGVISTSTTIASEILQRHRNNPKPWIGGAVDDVTARTLTKDMLFSARSGTGLGRSSKASAMGALRSFSVINGAGFENETKFAFFKRFWFVGLSANMMQANAVKTETSIHVAVNVQGMTYMYHNGDDNIHAGAQIMWDVPENTEDARRRLRALPDRAGAIPEDRFTAFPRVFRISDAINNVRGDWSRRLRIPPQVAANNRRPISYFPSTEMAIQSLRRFIAAGAAIAQFSAGGVNPQEMIGGVRQMANDPAQNDWYKQLAEGAYDAHIAAMLFPGDRERVVRGRKPEFGDTPVTRMFHMIQRAGFDDLFMAANRAIDEAGRSRVIGRAIAPAKPGDQLSILLYGH